MLEHKTFGGNLALKIGNKKTFGTMDWNFLLEVLKAFGFDLCFCQWIKVILHSAKLSFSVNGKSVGYFSCKRGVKQGDPLSPLLFCLVEDVLSKGITHLVQSGKLKPMTGPSKFQTPSHVFYVDGIMIFCKGTKNNLLMDLFRLYIEALG